MITLKLLQHLLLKTAHVATATNSIYVALLLPIATAIIISDLSNVNKIYFLNI